MDGEPAAAIDPTTNPADAPALDANGNPIEGEPVESPIPEEIQLDMRNIWSVFVNDKNQAPMNELATIMRSLDVDVSTDKLLKEVEQMIDPDNTGFITYEKLTEVMEEKLKEQHTVEDLTREMNILDLDNDGMISAPQFKQFMMNMGNKLQGEELDEFMKFADPKNEGVITIAELAEAMCPPKK